MEQLDDIFNKEAKSISEDIERDLLEKQDYMFLASLDIFTDPYVDYEKKLEKCRQIERRLDMMPYVSSHSDVFVYYPEMPDKKPGWLSDWNHKMLSLHTVSQTGVFVRFVFGFSGSFRTLNERKHMLWWLRKYCCFDNLCDISLINPFDFQKVSFSYNDCGVIALASKFPGSAEIKQHIMASNFERVYQLLISLEQKINEFFEPPLLSYELENGGMYTFQQSSGVCLLEPQKTFLVLPVI